MGEGVKQYQLGLLLELRRVKELKEFGVRPGRLEDALAGVRHMDQATVMQLRDAFADLSHEATITVDDHHQLVGLLRALVWVRDHEQLLTRIGCVVDHQRVVQLHTLINAFDQHLNAIKPLMSGSVSTSEWPVELHAVSRLNHNAKVLVRLLPLIDWRLLEGIARSLDSGVASLDGLHAQEARSLSQQLKRVRESNLRAIRKAMMHA